MVLNIEEQRVCVGIIGPARGLAGEVLVKPLTDYIEERFAPGEQLWDEEGATFTISQVRVINNRLCVTFAEVSDRNGAEDLRGRELFAQAVEEQDAFTREELQGLEVRDQCGILLGTVKDLELGDYQDRLVVLTEAGKEVLVPFVYEIVPEVNLGLGFVLVTPPPGLF